jgi:hypothetical protein
MRKKKDARPLPPMVVGDEEPSVAERLSDLVGKSLVRPDVPQAVEKSPDRAAPDRAEAGRPAVEEDEMSLAGCLPWIAVTVSILAFLKEADLPGELAPILALVVLVAAPVLYWWSTTRDERRRARQSGVSTHDSPSAQVAAPPPEDPPAVP